MDTSVVTPPRSSQQDSPAGAAPRAPWPLLLLLTSLVAALVLCGCQGMGGGNAVATARTQAEELATAGRYADAAARLEQAIAGTSGDLNDALLLEAAELWMFAGDAARAVALVEQRDTPLEAQDDVRPVTRLIGGSRALAAGELRAAQAWLAGIEPPYPASLAALILEQRARTAFRLGDAGGAVEALVEREVWLSSGEAIAGNHQLMWRELLALQPEAVAAAREGAADPLVTGWLELADIGRRARNSPGRGRDALTDWRNRYAGHPATADIIPLLLAQYRAGTDLPRRVALLLPLSGPLARSAQAVRDGFISTALSAGVDAADLDIAVYDTVEMGAAEAYALAVSDGAELVVGPLRKDAVAAVSAVSRRVPTLALNDPGDPGLPPGSDFFRFALSPEDEARQVTARAAADGHRNIIALVPNSGWGERMLASIREVLATGPDAVAAGTLAVDAAPSAGDPAAVQASDEAALQSEADAGTVPTYELPPPQAPALIDYSYYATGAVDFSGPIRRALRLDQSEARYDALRRVLATRLEHEPRRREDVDALVVAAPAAKAKLIRPQLRFHFAADLPVYMTSAALDPDPAVNGELDGVYFADIPWLITARNQTDARWQALRDYAYDGLGRARLFAFGADAFDLIPAIWGGVVGNEVLLEGLTGSLRAEPDGRIARQLPILQLQGERLVRMPDVPPAPPFDEPALPPPAAQSDADVFTSATRW